MTASTPTLADQIEVLASKATQGEWRNGEYGGKCRLDHFPHGQGQCDYRFEWTPGGTEITTANLPTGESWSREKQDEADGRIVAGRRDYEVDGIHSADDAALIVALHNGLPAIIEALRDSGRVRAVVDAAEAWERTRLCHHDGPEDFVVAQNDLTNAVCALAGSAR